MLIRYGTTLDATILSEFGIRAFTDSFGQDNTEENMRLYLAKTYSPEIQLNELTNPDVVFLIAQIETEIAGYTKLNLTNKDVSVKGNKVLEIERIYAAKEYIGKGIGKELMLASIQEARQRNCDSIWLGVWEKNPRAIAFYTKWGFKEVGTHIFMLGNDPQQDYIMELEISN